MHRATVKTSRASRRLQRAGDANCERKAPLSETKVKADLASRFSVRSARNFSLRQLEKLPRVIVCRELSDS